MFAEINRFIVGNVLSLRYSGVIKSQEIYFLCNLGEIFVVKLLLV
jgi:hypothetical protein